jgi:hypothetical protein
LLLSDFDDVTLGNPAIRYFPKKTEPEKNQDSKLSTGTRGFPPLSYGRFGFIEIKINKIL